MKKLFAIIVLMALAMNGISQILNYDFSAECETGQTLYYRISSEEEHTVTLTHPYSEENGFHGDYYEGFTQPQGDIILPSIVDYNGVQYFVTAIDKNAFWACHLTGSLTIPEGIVSIGACAFEGCFFTTISIPKSTEVISSASYGYGTPFGYCSSLESIVVDEANPVFYSENNALIKRQGKVLVQGCKTTIIPDDVEAIGRSSFQGAGDGGNLVIPNSVISIDEYAFHHCNFSGTLMLSDSLRYIGANAFSESNFTGSLSLPNTVTEIGAAAFRNCGFSGDLILPSSITSINTSSFYSSNFSGTLVIPNSVTYIGLMAFEGTNFSELVLGNSLEYIDNHAFNNWLSNTHLTGVLRLPASLTEIGISTFAYTSFDEIYSPNTTPPSLDNSSFYECDPNIPVHIPFGCTEAYQNAEGWNYFTNFIEDLENTSLYTYGYLCQPDSAVIELDPNSSMGSEYGDFHARFTYRPNGLLNTQSAFSILSGSSADYDHFYKFYYDSDYHVIQQNDTYYGMGAEPFLNHYIYENGLLMTYTRHLNNYHEDDTLILWDSISYTYDELRRLHTEKRFIRTTSEKTYEYNENQVIITTDGYTDGTSGDWLTLSREIRTFNEDSLLVSSQTEKYNDSTILVTYGYDGQRHRTSILTQKRNNGVWENQKLVQYHFNPNGRLTRAEIKLWQDDAFVDAHRAVYELNEMGYPATVTFERWDDEAWRYGVWQSDFYLYDEGHLQQQNDMLYSYRNSIHKIELTYIVTNNPREPLLPDNSEWFYEIENEEGTITYQHLEYAADTTIGTQRPKIIVRSNTHYDRDIWTEVTHEYVYEENGIVYWWNKDLEEFTTLYNLAAETGDEWEIKVGTESIIMHVDSVEYIDYGGQNYRTLHVSDENDLFSGDIVCGIGHMTSFFPERLMTRGKSYRVAGLRCYWVEGNLIFKINRDDCDAIYSELHNGLDEPTGEAAFLVYPNPANGVLFIETHGRASLQTAYRITNLMGQTILSGNITAENQRIDIESLPAGMYFITFAGETLKFVVK